MKTLALTFVKLLARLEFQKVSQTPRSRSHGKKYWYPWKGLVPKNNHVKYQSSSALALKCY